MRRLPEWGRDGCTRIVLSAHQDSTLCGDGCQPRVIAGRQPGQQGGVVTLAVSEVAGGPAG